MNDFLSAEQRLRLKCVLLHSTQDALGDKELSPEEVGFVLGIKSGLVRWIEYVAIQKMKKRGKTLKELE